MARLNNGSTGTKIILNEKLGPSPVGKKLQAIGAKEKDEWYYVQLDDIEPNANNHYKIEDLESLVDSLDDYGLMHNIVLQDQGEGRKKLLISGERRYWAAIEARKSGKRSFPKGLMAKVIPQDVDPIDAEIMLIQANKEVRNRNQATRLYEVKRLTELYTAKKAKGESVKETVSARIAKELDVTQRQVQKIMSISKKGIPEIQKAVEDELITLEDASKYVQLSEEFQHELVKLLNESETKTISEEDFQTLKKQEETLKNENEELKNRLNIEIANRHRLEILAASTNPAPSNNVGKSVGDIFAGTQPQDPADAERANIEKQLHESKQKEKELRKELQKNSKPVGKISKEHFDKTKLKVRMESSIKKAEAELLVLKKLLKEENMDEENKEKLSSLLEMVSDLVKIVNG